MASVLKEKHWKPIENPQDHCVVAFERSQLTIHMGIYFPEIKRVFTLWEKVELFVKI